MHKTNQGFSVCLVMMFSLVTAVSIAQEKTNSIDESQTVFSGPQPGESVPRFTMNTANVDNPGQAIDVVQQVGDKPLVIIFFHEKTRPAFGLMRAITKYSATKRQSGLTTAVCFLTKDPAETTRWVNQVTQHLPKNVQYGVYPDGMEGPGAYGLNRNVALTVLVANKSKVVHNSALVQPSLEADGSKILKAIVEVTGGGKVPDIKTFSGQAEMARQKANAEPNMRPWLAPVIKKGATNGEVDKAAQALEAKCKKDEAYRKAVGRISTTVVNSGKLEDYGTLHAQNYLKKWAKEFGEDRESPKVERDGKMSKGG